MTITDDGGDRGPDANTTLTSKWAMRSFDLSSYSSAQRDVVTAVKFTITLTAGGGQAGPPFFVYIDYVYADPGPSQIEAYDGDRIIDIYPKVYCGTYTGNATNNTVITLPRKGIPSVIFVKHYDAASYSFTVWWHKSMAAGKSERFDGGAATISEGIKAVADGSFTIGYTAITSPVNLNGEQYNYIVLWED
jgi:hypothetical protein